MTTSSTIASPSVVQNEPVKRKKGRPRKDAVPVKMDVASTQQDAPVEKKRRGRKPKEIQPSTEEPQVVKKKKRGRKPQLKFYSSSIRKQIPLTTQLQDNDNFILHLDSVKEDEKQTKEYACFDTEHDLAQHQNSKAEVHSDNETQESSVDLFEKEYNDFINNDDAILSDFIDGNMDDLRSLYEKRIKYREDQDLRLVNKLERLHQDDTVLEKLVNTRFRVRKSSTTLEGHDSNKHTSSQADNVRQNEADTTNQQTGQYELLSQFLHSDTWLRKTNVSCWWCCHSFNTVPLGLPLKYDIDTKKFRVQGVYCSFACMMASHQDKPRKSEAHLIKYLYSKVTGTPLIDCQITPAPPRSCLAKFGGPLSIDQFRNATKENKVYKMVEYPMFVLRTYIEEVDIANIKKVNNTVFNDSSRVGIENDQRKVEEAKQRLMQKKDTVVTTGNTIETFIKFG